MQTVKVHAAAAVCKFRVADTGQLEKEEEQKLLQVWESLQRAQSHTCQWCPASRFLLDLQFLSQVREPLSVSVYTETPWSGPTACPTLAAGSEAWLVVQGGAFCPPWLLCLYPGTAHTDSSVKWLSAPLHSALWCQGFLPWFSNWRSKPIIFESSLSLITFLLIAIYFKST